MEFLTPAFLLGGAAIAAPIIIHLLNRQRYKRVEWAAMRFIVEAIKRTHRRLKLEELILLAMRCAILILLAATLARPYFTGSFLGMRAEGNFHAIVAIDSTYSMEAQVGHQKFFDRAREVAGQIIGTLKRGDKLSIVTASRHAATLHADPTVRFEEAVAELNELKVSHFGGALVDSLETIRTLVTRSKPLKSHIYVITDNQARFWHGLETFENKKLLDDLTSPAVHAARLAVIDVGSPIAGNLAAVSLRADAPIVTPNIPFRFVAEIASFSDAPATTDVSLSVDGERIMTQSVAVDPGKTSTVTFGYSFPRAGAHYASVELEADPLLTDNRRYFALQVEEMIKVLVVDPKASMRDSETETFGLRMALNPLVSENRQDVSPLRPVMISPEELAVVPLSEYAAVILADVERIPPPVIEALTDYVKNGGGVMVFGGPRVDPASYTQHFFRNGEGFLAAPLTGRGGVTDQSRFTRVDLEPTDHPVVRKLQQEQIQFAMYAYQYLTCGPLPKDAQVIARYVTDTAAPAIVERAIGKGRSVLITTSCGDPAWSEMFVDYPMIPLLHEYALLLGAGARSMNNLAVGDRLSHALAPGPLKRELLLIPPEGTPIPQTVSHDDGEMRVNFGEVDRAGVYRLTERDSLIACFAGNIDPDESEMERIAAARLDALKAAHNFTVASYDQGLESFSKEAGGKELWLYFLLALGALMAAEMFFAMKFGAHKK
jgi:hypothetical protein